MVKKLKCYAATTKATVKMRIYNIIRFGQRIRYAEVCSQSSTRIQAYDAVYIPGSIPKILDPYICLKDTSDLSGIKQIEVQDKSGKTWFEVKSDFPISKMKEYSTDLAKEMR